VWSVAFSPEGRRIVSGSADSTVRLWDTVTGQPIGQPLTGHTGIVESAAFPRRETHRLRQLGSHCVAVGCRTRRGI
jgi:WD40 repeat protein